MLNVEGCEKAVLAWELELEAALVDGARVGGPLDADPCAIPPGRAAAQRPGRGVGAYRAIRLAEDGGDGCYSKPRIAFLFLGSRSVRDHLWLAVHDAHAARSSRHGPGRWDGNGRSRVCRDFLVP